MRQNQLVLMRLGIRSRRNTVASSASLKFQKARREAVASTQVALLEMTMSDR